MHPPPYQGTAQERHFLNPGEMDITPCRDNFPVGKNTVTYTKLSSNGEERTERILLREKKNKGQKQLLTT